MFSKSPRFQRSGSTPSDGNRKSLADTTRESTGPETRDGEQTPSVRKINSVESENVQPVKRPITSDRKMESLDKKHLASRGLKRTASFIPRATNQTLKTPVTEVKKPERRSETSLKNKESFENLSKNKKSQGLKTTLNLLDPKLSAESNVAHKMREHPKKNRSTSRSPESSVKAHSVSGMSVRGFHPKQPRHGEKPESKSQKGNSVSSTDDTQALSKSLQTQYAAKKAIYGNLVKEFQASQKKIRDQYKVLQEIRARILVNNGNELPPEDSVNIIDLEPPFHISEEVLKKLGPVQKRAITTFESKVFDDVTVDFTDFKTNFETPSYESRDIWIRLLPSFMNSRKHMIRKLSELDSTMDMTEFEHEDKQLETEIENAKYFSKLKLDEMITETKKLYLNRETIQQEIKTLMDGDKFNSLLARDYKEMTNRLKEMTEELTKEKIRTENLIEKRNQLEEEKKAETKKIETLEQTISDLQNQVVQLSGQCKTLKKDLTSSKPVAGLKPKDMKDLKAKTELLKALENHITELTNDHKSEKKIMESRISELEQALSEKDAALKSESEAKQFLEASLAEAEEKIRNIREKRKIFTEMVDKTKQILHTANDGTTKREEQLWTELEATKILVKGYQDQVNKINNEKNKLLIKFQTISEDKSNENAERLAADLVRKEEMIRKLNEQVTEMQKTCEEHSAKYNKLLVQLKEVHEKMDDKTDAASLSKQLRDIKMQKKELKEVVKDLVSHNQELETALVQRSLELDQRDRLVKQQCNLLQMRDELSDLVKSKDETQHQGVKVLEQSSKWEKKAEKIYKDLERKATELDDMYKVLVDKQKQVEKLTKLVKIMEEQQDRAQEQRVRFETKISELQKQIAEGKPKQPLKTPLFEL